MLENKDSDFQSRKKQISFSKRIRGKALSQQGSLLSTKGNLKNQSMVVRKGRQTDLSKSKRGKNSRSGKSKNLIM